MISAAVLLLFTAAVLIAIRPAIERGSIYFPMRDYEAGPQDFGLRAEPLELQSSDGVSLRGWWIRGTGRTVLVYFHGNGGNVSHRLERAKLLIDGLGIDIALVDYRGYGRSEGVPSEAGLYADGEAIYQAVRDRGFPPAQIVFFGESLGCGVAIETALRKPAKAVILEAPFLSIPRMARVVYPFLPGFLVRTRFDNETKIPRVAIPKLIAAAERDDVVPTDQTLRLFELAREPKKFYMIRGATHNDTYIVGGKDYIAAWKSFLEID